MKKKSDVIEPIKIIIVLIIVLLVGYLIYSYVIDQSLKNTPIPVDRKIADITDNTVSAVIKWPNAEPSYFELVVGLPFESVEYTEPSEFWDSRQCPEFEGQVIVKTLTGNLIEQFNVSSDNVERCNWLTDNKLDGYIMTGKRDNVLDSCAAGQTYVINLEFKKRPKEFCSLWLSYMQSQKQREEERKTQKGGKN